MLKCSNLMYCFELDGVLVDNVPYDDNVVIRNVSLFKNKSISNPNELDIRWNIITNRPRVDIPWIKLFCFKNGMTPCEIITYKKFLKRYNLAEYSADFKLSIFKDILDGKRSVKYTKNKVENIMHICNDQTENYYINSNRDNYPIISVSMIDFKREFFNHIV